MSGSEGGGRSSVVGDHEPQAEQHDSQGQRQEETGCCLGGVQALDLSGKPLEMSFVEHASRRGDDGQDEAGSEYGHDRDQREGHSLILMPEFDGRPVGQFTLSQVQWGAMSQGVLGYWVAQEASRMGLASLVVSYMMDLVIGELGLHRIEVNVRPENERSLGLCRKLGLREEGYRERYMNIAGQWADHVSFAMDAESLPEGGMLTSLYGKGLR